MKASRLWRKLRLILEANGHIILLLVLLVIGAGIVFGSGGNSMTLRKLQGIFSGQLPEPSESAVLSALPLFKKKSDYQLMRVRHIPIINGGVGMPHPYVGDCKRCHLQAGGPPAGSQPKTPVGAILERLSRVTKLGPPILPTSQQPHPAAGRCIKCHDIVVKAPLKPAKNLWQL